MPDTDTLDPKDLFAACEAEFRALIPLIQSWWSGNRTFRQIIKPAFAYLEVIAEKAGEIRPHIAIEGEREKWIAAGVVYTGGLLTGREDIIPFVDDERVVRWLIRAIRSAVEMWRAKRAAGEADPVAPVTA